MTLNQLSKSRLITEKITYGALLASIAIIMKLFLTFETMEIRITFFEVPIMFAGILLGPLYGAFVGLITDVVYMMINIRGLNVGLNLFTLEAIMYGLIPGIVFLLFRYNIIKQSVATLLTMIIAFTISTIQLYLWTKNGIYVLLPWRVLALCLKVPLEITILHTLLTNRHFSQFNPYRVFFRKHNLY